MIRDHLVVGLRNEKLSEKLQMNASLTLENTVLQARQTKSVRKQQGVIRSALSPQANVESVEVRQHKPQKSRLKTKQPGKPSGDGSKPRRRNSGCERCGYYAKRNRQECPARDVKRHKCSKQGYFTKWCRARKEANGVNEVEVADGSISDSEQFLGKVT